MTKTKYSFLIF